MSKRLFYPIVVIGCCGLLALFFLNPVDYIWMPKCPIKMLFGIECPGCGFQRAAHALLHGRFIEAIGYNLFFVVAFPYLISVLLGNFLREGRLRQKYKKIVEHKWMTYGYIMLFFIWFIIRNIIKM
jgi:hypothetical protein